MTQGSGRTPLIVAHRAGNHPARVGPAVAAGADVLELDVHLRRGRLEVRHPRRAGPLLWDREGVALARPPLPGVADIAAAAGAAGLMLDLKDGPPALAAAAVAAARDGGPPREMIVVSRRWALLDPVAGHAGVRTVLTAGSPCELAALRRRLARPPAPGGVCVRRSLLDPDLAAELAAAVPLVMTWPVISRSDARTLLEWGVTGLICDALAGVGALASSGPAR